MRENKLSGLIGHPLGHSVSPFIHEYLGKARGINVRYDKFDLEKDELEGALKKFASEGFAGLNVTLPYKSVIMDNLFAVSDAAQTIGAVNTIVGSPDGFIGYNTDYLGLKRELSYYNIDIKDKNVVILGAGGASKAVRYLCTILGAAKIYQFNRTPGTDGARALDEALKLTKDQKQIVFQTTSVGMFPNTESAPIMDDDFYQGIECGIDIIYNPLSTMFMKKVKAGGGRAYNGLRMLLYQAVEAFKLFYDIEEISDDTEENCYLNLLFGMNKNIVLCGMMGCGKSTLGKSLAANSDALFIDTDEYIEKKLGMTINDIFAKHGEEAFRRIEHETLSELLLKYRNSDRKTVYSLGGGMCRKENIELIRQLGYVCYINCDADILCSRLRGDTSRPLLKDVDLYTRISKLLKERSSLYLETCDEIIGN